MILVVGDPEDVVIARLMRRLCQVGAEFALLDDRTMSAYQITCRRQSIRWAVTGRSCTGRRPVSAIFVRHSDRFMHAEGKSRVEANGGTALRRLLARTQCEVMNRAQHSYGNFSKPLQLRQLALAGFSVPRTLVANSPSAAKQFVRAVAGPVIFKGVSSARTDPQLLDARKLRDLPLIKNCPVQFQEFIDGVDIRVTVVGHDAIVSPGMEFGPSASRAGAVAVPAAEVQRCIAFTCAQGLWLSGIDLRMTPSGRVYAFEMNPYPLYSHFEGARSLEITRLVAERLLRFTAAKCDIAA